MLIVSRYGPLHLMLQVRIACEMLAYQPDLHEYEHREIQEVQTFKVVFDMTD